MAKALALSARLSHNNGVDLIKEERYKLIQDCCLLEKKLSSTEKEISYVFPTNYYQALVDGLSTTDLFSANDTGGKVYHPIKAIYQADTLIVKKLTKGSTSVSLANDTGFAFLGSKSILQLSGFKMRGKSRDTRTIKDLTVITPHLDTHKMILKIISHNEKLDHKMATYGIFDTINKNHHIIRALSAVSL